MKKQEINLEDFQKIIRQQFSEKGIIPPVEDSDEEKRLFEQWMKGVEKLKIHDD